MRSAEHRPPARYLEVRTELLTRVAGSLHAAARTPHPSVLRDTLPPSSAPPARGRVYRTARARRRAALAWLARWAAAVGWVTGGGLFGLAVVLAILALTIAGLGLLAGLLLLAGVLLGMLVVCRVRPR
ncbi:hypothetical protein [Micromonospora sp. RP3T]|uniref:hypothetical protein n=1 Tax=Micromonospora sp. RP3T TaxID=2135446 RepID=UPI003D7616D6